MREHEEKNRLGTGDVALLYATGASWDPFFFVLLPVPEAFNLNVRGAKERQALPYVSHIFRPKFVKYNQNA